MDNKTAKLSKMQRAILAMALDRRQTAKTDPNSDRSQPFHANGVDVYYAEVLAELFGFEPIRDPGSGGQRFTRTAIGPRRYDAAQASLSRAVGRLEGRGLVVVLAGRYSRWSGVQLTDEGVKTVGNFPQSQPLHETGNDA